MSTFEKHWILSPKDIIRTFDSDENLPPLPVPALEKTIERYIKSVKPFAENDEEYENTKKLATDFLNGIGASLNEKLLKRASKHKNWVEKWWEDYAYLSLREPLIPYYNMAGPHPSLPDFPYGPGHQIKVEKWWEDYAYLSLREPLIPYYNMAGPHPSLPDFPYGPGHQIKVAASYCHQVVRMWKLLRGERLRPAATSGKPPQPLSMDQFRRVFNCSVVPAVGQDTIKTFFKTEREGFCSSQVVVLCNGHMFLVDGVQPGGTPLTAVEWESQLNLIKQKATPQRGPDVPCLVADSRNLWAQNRQRLADFSPVNTAIFKSLDSAMFVLCLDEASPESEEAVGQLVLYGNYSCRWPDKATSIIVFDNGRVGGLCLHSPFDGIVSGEITLYTYAGVRESWNNNTDSSVIHALVEPQNVNFILDQHIKNEIKRAKTDIEIEKKKFIMCRQDFKSFGKQRIQKLKVHPDALIQMALQLAYYRLHSKFAPCYETATTRKFYHGRTETVRSCSEDCVLWVNSMVNPHQKVAERAKLLRKAIQTQKQLMTEATNGEGCDRHLFGLYCIAMEDGLTVPEFFHDPLFTRSGGNGNFVLSTSLLGYSPLSGGVSPMCVHGYGVFYSILPDSVLFTLTARTDSTETSPGKMLQSIMSSLQDAASLLDTEPTAKL